jgi:formate dehydrogenase subunit beta
MMDMIDMMEQIQAKAQELLSDDEVTCVIGYETGPRGVVRPFFAYEPDEADRLVWNDRCNHNLTTYLRDWKLPRTRDQEPPRVGIVVKACDARALNVLFQEKQVARDRTYVIGVVCHGMRDGDGDDAPRLRLGSEQVQARCQRCAERTPVVHDLLVGEPTVAPARADWADVEALEAMTASERLVFWVRQFDRCLRCYACRQACPGCYCYECLAEQVDPQWVGIGMGFPEKHFFHIMRAYHLAGRCVDCDACERVCPVNIPLSLLNRRIAREIADLFDFTPGLSPDEPSPLTTFLPNEELPL